MEAALKYLVVPLTFAGTTVRTASSGGRWLTCRRPRPADTSFHDFVEHPVMKEIKERSIFIHVDLPGQEDDANDLPEE